MPGSDADDDVGDRNNYLVLAKPNVIMNDIRLRGLAVAGSDAGGRKNPHNHAQTARNLRRSLRNAAAGARLIQAEGLDSKPAADLAACLADALEELHRLQRSLDRRIRRDHGIAVCGYFRERYFRRWRTLRCVTYPHRMSSCSRRRIPALESCRVRVSLV